MISRTDPVIQKNDTEVPDPFVSLVVFDFILDNSMRTVTSDHCDPFVL